MNGFLFNLENGIRFKYLMYPRFLQMIINEEFPDIREDGMDAERLMLEQQVYQRLIVITGTEIVALFDYIQNVANDDFDIHEDHFHLTEDMPIDPADLEVVDSDEIGNDEENTIDAANAGDQAGIEENV